MAKGMTIKEAKLAVKAKYPKAVCCSVMKDRTWHLVVRSQRNGQCLGDLVSVQEVGYEGLCWKSAALQIRA